MADGRPFRMLTVVNQRSRSGPILEAAFSIREQDVAAALDQTIAMHGAPRSITVDHGAE
ncbi:MAG TPA: hypothetical protein VGM77_12345 [Gemmatimonadales bacterium]|jgi:putative transposase